MSVTITESRVVWAADLVASTLSTVFPSGATAGVALPQGGGGNTGRVAVKLNMSITTAPMSAMVAVYGYDDAGVWQYLNSLNAGSSITANTSKWGSTASTAVLTEILTTANTNQPVYSGNFSRYATRLIVSASPSAHTASTWIGEAQT